MVGHTAADDLGLTSAAITITALREELNLLLLQCEQEVRVLLIKQQHWLTIETDYGRFFKDFTKGQSLQIHFHR